MSWDELDDLDDEEVFESYDDTSSGQVDTFYEENKPKDKPKDDDSRLVSFITPEAEKKPEEPGIYDDIFAGTNKKQVKENDNSIPDPRWDGFRVL